MKILAIETSCDETSLAIVEASGGLRAPKFRVIKNLVASQIKIHRPFGGVVPNLAKREHLKNLPLLWKRIKNDELRIKGGKKSLNSKSSILNSIDLIAVTVGPGLEPALWTGISFAKSLLANAQINADQDADKRGYKNISENRREHLRKSAQPKLIGANHLEGHLYSFLLPPNTTKSLKLKAKSLFPAIVLLVSGGHTTLLKMDSLTRWKKLGETRDDAAGEAFDKVARMLELPYPGGPEIEQMAKRGKRKEERGKINFPRPMMHDKSYDFSFSGLKTAVLYYIKEVKSKKQEVRVRDVAAAFQEAAVDVLTHKTMRATREFDAKSVILCGGVAANKALRKKLKAQSLKLKANFFVPDFKYNMDNAAMIAAAGYMSHLRGKKYKLAARGDMNI